MTFDQLDTIKLDTLREVCNIGAGHAATALHQLTGQRIHLEVPKVRLVSLARVPEVLGSPEQVVAGLYFRILGQARGDIFMVFPTESAIALLSFIGCAVPASHSCLDLDEISTSSLKEVGNILSSAYLTAINQLTGLVLIPSVPSYACDMAGSIVDYVLIEVGKVSDVALVVETVFLEKESRVLGHFFLLPDPGSLEVILKALAG